MPNETRRNVRSFVSSGNPRTIRLLVLLLVIVGVCIAAFAAVRTLSGSRDVQAVFLDNGQVYFGRVQDSRGQTLRLEDVYYLDIGQNPHLNGSPTDNLSLIKLGSEAHGPEDGMDINWDHILFVETLRADAKVVEAMQRHRQSTP